MTFDSPAPKVTLSLTVDAEDAQRYLMLYLLMEGNTEDAWHWGSHGEDIVRAWHFAGNMLIDTCNSYEAWVSIRTILDALIAQWELAGKYWENPPTPLPPADSA